MKKYFNLDVIIFAALAISLGSYFLGLFPDDTGFVILNVVGIAATIPVFWSALVALRNRKISVDLLGSIALVAAIAAREASSVVFINLMITSARILAAYTEGQTRSAILKLLKLRPQTVKVRRGTAVFEERIENLKVGDMVVLESGERVPVDGTVETGEGSVDQSSLTGESMPVSKTMSSKVFSSTLLVSGSLMVRAERVGKDTTLEKIIELVKTSQDSKAPITTIADRFASYYIAAVLIGSVGIYYYFGDFKFLLALLLVACADDIAVAIPLAFWASIGRAARRGIIIKGGNFLEGLTHIGTLVMDKTGTLTKGHLKVYDVTAWGDFTKEKVLEIAAAAEFFSDHPAARAIVAHAGTQKIKFVPPVKFEEYPGRGITAAYGGADVLVGKTSFIQESGITFSAHEMSEITAIKNSGLNVTQVASGGKPIGFVALADEVRPEARGALQRLRRDGVGRFIMLTGDNERVAERIAKETGIGEFHANLLPEDKLNFIKKLLGGKSKVAMAGDGVNDAAALSLADVGIAMGVIGADAAIEAADIALMQDNFEKIAEAHEIGSRTMYIVYENFAIWMVVNVVGFVLVFGRVIGPEGASAYNFLTDFLPLLNSMRLFKL